MINLTKFINSLKDSYVQREILVPQLSTRDVQFGMTFLVQFNLGFYATELEYWNTQLL